MGQESSELPLPQGEGLRSQPNAQKYLSLILGHCALTYFSVIPTVRSLKRGLGKQYMLNLLQLGYRCGRALTLKILPKERIITLKLVIIFTWNRIFLCCQRAKMQLKLLIYYSSLITKLQH